ncbi:hypothetical protein P4233_12300 [Pseudomonas aeruginosa]|nr:hypothetical protein [Pseudomonas aeruginosa]
MPATALVVEQVAAQARLAGEGRLQGGGDGGGADVQRGHGDVPLDGRGEDDTGHAEARGNGSAGTV